MLKRLADCQRVIGYHFADVALLEVALTHSSVRTPDRECNERQEFLGDSVLGLAMTEELYKRLPNQQEGELTRIKSAVVSRGALYRVSMRLGLPRFIEVAKGVGRREEIPVSVTANLVESIIGAIYLDAGFFPAREFILRHLGPELEDVFNDRVPKNYKSLVQHEAQQVFGTTPIYRTVEEEGPDHRKSFTVACIVRGTEYGRANGINKKEAEQEAARHALDALSRRSRGGRRRRPDARGGREGEREQLRPLVRQTSDEEAWREWAESNAPRSPEATGVAEGGGPPPAAGGVRPEVDEPWHDAGDEGAGARPVSAEADAETGRAPAPSGTGAGEGGAPSEGDDDRGPRRRRRRGGRGRGRSRREEGAPDSAGDGGDAPAPAGIGAEASDGAGPAGTAPEEPVAPPTEAREDGPRRRVGARSRLDRYRDADAPSGRPAAPSAEAPHARAPEPSAPAPARGTPEPRPRPTGPAFGDGVAAAPTPPPRGPEKAVTPLGGVASVKKAPKPDAPRGGGGFGAGL